MSLIVIVIILGVVVPTLGALIYFKVPLTKKDELAKTISITGGMMAALSLFWAAYTFHESSRIQKELAAVNIYREHMMTSMREQKFLGTADFANINPPTNTSPLAEQNAYEPYKWYVGHALFSFESILEVSDDPGWKGTFQGFICDHKKYLRSGEFDASRYAPKLQELLKETYEKKCP